MSAALKSNQKYISTSLASWVKRYQKHLQQKENIKYGRRAKTISFVFATKSPTALAKFINSGGLK
jgi:hypothetical protein